MAEHAMLDAQTVEECIIDQGWGNYTKDDHETWSILFNRQKDALAGHVCQEYLDGLNRLGIVADQVPDFEQMNKSLRAATGWEVLAVQGLIPSKPFFQMLANRQFPSGNFIRTREQLDYLEEPDIFHDVFGHVPLLTNPAYADYMQAYGEIGLRAMESKGVKFLARLNWYTIEFGLIRKPEGIQIYGAGIVSSFGETKYVIEDKSANFVQFDLERAMRTGYYIDDLQATYFVVDSFEALFKQLEGKDLDSLYPQWREMPEYSPFRLEDRDDVIRKGTGEYWKDFPQIKTKLK